MSRVNGKSRQRMARILLAVDDWLQARAAARQATPKAGGVATEINAILNSAYEAETGNDPHTGEPV